MITTVKELRKLFWQEHPHCPRKKITHYSGNGTMFPTDTRVAFSNWKDALGKAGTISQQLLDNATL